MNILFIGDVFGEPGRSLIVDGLFKIRHEEKIDFCIANCENASHGRGLSRRNAKELLESGVDFITMGNHTWSNNEIYDYIDEFPVIRPVNFAESLPGRGFAVVTFRGIKIGVLNIEGRVFIEPPGDNPFEAADNAVNEIKSAGAKIIIVDFHAETTSEKKALALYLDGRVSAVIGTHTHVATADEQILKGGTAFITDVGMTGVCDGSIIGMNSRLVTEKFVRGVPVRFEPALGNPELNGVILEFDDNIMSVKSIRRLRVKR